MSLPEIDIVIVNWNTGPRLRACVDSIAGAVRERGPRIRVIVVDNASGDGSLDSLDGSPCPVERVRNSANFGFARACNQGAGLGTAEFLLFLNPDTEVSSDALAASLEFLRDPAHREYGVCGVQLRDLDGRISRSCARFPSAFHLVFTSVGLAQLLPALPLGIAMTDWDHIASRDVDHVMGAYYLVRRSLFESLGGFDERFFVYLEDLDLSLRIRNRGLKSRYLADVSAKHVGGGSSQQIKARRLFYSLDSRIAYVQKHRTGIVKYGLVALVLLIEPAVRVASVVIRGDLTSARETMQAYRTLWQKHLRT